MSDEPVPDWRLLAPHRPLGPDDGTYVLRPTGGGDAIASWVNAGGSTVLVSGPTGIGKSTELAHAAQALRATRVACLVRVDRMTNVHRLAADELTRIVARGLVDHARNELNLPLSPELQNATQGHRPAMSGPSALRAAVDEVARRSGRVALLIDGMEKLPPGSATREIFDELSTLPDEVDLIVIIPWHAAFGGGTDAILRAGERLHRIPPIDTDDPSRAVVKFFYDLLVRRLTGWSPEQRLPEPFRTVAVRSIKFSGGIPRVFLQLVADAGTYARAKRGAAWPDEDDLDDAIADQQDSFRRALLPGDTQAILAVEYTDGRELDLERRVRLLAQGILLERTRNGRIVLEPHPLAAAAISTPQP